MRILLAGYGVMNERVATLATKRGHDIVGIISSSNKSYPYPTIDVHNKYEADVIIDFSNPALTLPVINNTTIPIVVATTGDKEEIITALNNKATDIPVFFSANMSYGVHILTEIIKYSVPLLESFDIEMIEKHHNKKVDAPSGTLNKLLDAVQELRQVKPVYDRTTHARQQGDIGINVVRGGTVVGEHEIGFYGHDESIQIIHKAQSKDIFANGAIDVAEQLINKENGYYTFHNL